MFDRLVIKKILPFLETHDILLFYWARQVWKSSLMELIKEKYLKTPYFSFDLEEPGNLHLLNQGVNVFINELISLYGWNESEDVVIFIDEIQYLENPTSFLKYIHDHYKHIKFIVSWSSTLEIRGKFKDSLAWRMLRFDINPLSFEEFLIFKWKNILVNAIWKESLSEDISKQLISYYKEYLMFWWYPKIALTNWIDRKIAYLWEIFDNYINKDIKDIWKIRDVISFNNFLKILSEQVWNLINYTELSNKIGINLWTLKNWIALLENTFVIKILYPYNWNIRWELTKTPKIFFNDTWIRNYCLNSYEITGNLFENGFLSYIMNRWMNKDINFFRNKDKQEIDFIIDSVPYELKLSYNWKALSSLRSFEEKTNSKWKIITLNKENNSRRSAYYPRELGKDSYSPNPLEHLSDFIN